MSFTDTVEAATLEAPKKVEIHFDQRAVDHPLVPIRWCLSKETTEFMRRNPHLDWALVIVAQKPEIRDEVGGRHLPGDSRAESREIVEGLNAISVGRGFFKFRAPGTYTVVAYLVHSNSFDNHDSDSRLVFWRRVRALTTRHFSSYGECVTFRQVGARSSRTVLDHSYATDRVPMIIPEGIFAAEMKPWVRKYLSFFNLGVGEDECAGRWRLFVAFVPAPAAYAVAYVIMAPLVRIWLALLGVCHLLLGGNPLIPWKKVFSSWFIFPPGAGPAMRDEFDHLEIFESDIGSLFTPVIPLVTLSVLYFIFSFTPFGWFAVVGLLTFFCFAVISSLLEQSGRSANKKKRHKSETWIAKREREAQSAERKALAKIARVEQFAICGGDQTESPQTVELFWTGLKRRVCKPRQTA